MIGKDKIALIKIAQKQLGMADADYRALLQRAAGVRSSTELDEARFTAVMGEFARMGFESTANKERRLEAQREGTHATYRQKQKIRAMWNAWQGRADEAGLNRWLEAKFRCTHIRFLLRGEANKVIAALAHFKPKAAPIAAESQNAKIGP